MQSENVATDTEDPLKLGIQAAAKGDTAQALRYFELAAAAKPGRPTAFLKSGNLLRELDRLDEAATAYNSALTVVPDNAVALLGLAHIARARNDDASSMAYLLRAQKSDPDNLKVLMQLGGMLRKASRLEEAQAAYEQALEKAPNNAKAIAFLKQIARKRGDSDAEARYSGRAAAANPTAAKLRIARTKGDDAAACEYLREAADAEPDNVEILAELALTLRKLGRLDEAADTYRSVLARDARHVKAHLGLAFIARAHKNDESALAYFRAAAKLDPENLEILLHIAEILVEQNRKEEADEVCQSVLAKFPKDPKVLAALGIIAQKNSNWAAAVTYFEAAVAADPEKRQFQIQLGRAYCDALRLDDAEVRFLGVLQTSPDNVEATMGLGETARLRGDPRAALAFFETAAKLAPANLTARASIRNLKIAAGEFDWRTEIDEAIDVARTPDAPVGAQLSAATTLVEHGIIDVARPVLTRLQTLSPVARQLILAAREIERIGLAQPLSTDGTISDSGDNQLDALQGFHEKPVAGSDTLLIVFAGRNNRVWLTFSLLHRILRSTGVNIVYVRDLQETWYTQGVIGLGDDYESTVLAFKTLASRYGAQRILTLGNCVGSLGALRYGLSLGAFGVLGIAPNIRPIGGLKPEFAARMEALRKLLPAGRKDMHTQYMEADARPDVSLVYGEQCEPDASDAKFMTDVPGVKIAGVPEASSHDCIKDLLIRGLLEPLLQEFVANGDVSAELLSRISASTSP